MSLTLSGTNGVVGAGFTLDPSGASVTAGVGTFSSVRGTHHGDGHNLTSINAANLVGVCTSGLTKTGGFGGITMTDIWYVSSSFTGSADPIASNWSQYTLHNSGSIGGSMTQSSGIFTFPETGIYRISWWTQAYRAGGAVNYSKVMLETTTNNSSYSTIPSGYTSFNSNSDTGGWYGTMSAEHFVDISDVSNTKVRFQAEQETTGSTMEQVFVYFIRLGDT